MNRRQLLKLLTAGVVGLSADIDLDRLLWVPTKTIFLPSAKQAEFYGRPLTIEMMEEVMRKISLKVPALFDRDDMFYKQLKKVELTRETLTVSAREMKIPLIIKPGDIDWNKKE